MQAATATDGGGPDHKLLALRWSAAPTQERARPVWSLLTKGLLQARIPPKRRPSPNEPPPDLRVTRKRPSGDVERKTGDGRQRTAGENSRPAA